MRLNKMIAAIGLAASLVVGVLIDADLPDWIDMVLFFPMGAYGMIWYKYFTEEDHQ